MTAHTGNQPTLSVIKSPCPVTSAQRTEHRQREPHHCFHGNRLDLLLMVKLKMSGSDDWSKGPVVEKRLLRNALSRNLLVARLMGLRPSTTRCHLRNCPATMPYVCSTPRERVSTAAAQNAS